MIAGKCVVVGFFAAVVKLTGHKCSFLVLVMLWLDLWVTINRHLKMQYLHVRLGKLINKSVTLCNIASDMQPALYRR